MSYLSLPASRVEVLAEADVVVCGGGCAGVAAAVAAARHGASVVQGRQGSGLNRQQTH